MTLTDLPRPQQPQQSAPKQSVPAAPAMTKWRYRCTNNAGDTVRGTLSAPSRNAAVNQLAMEGLRVVHLRPMGFNNIELGESKLKASELLSLSRQLGSFLAAGIPVIQSFEAVQFEAKKNSMMNRVIGDIVNSLKAGNTLASSLAVHEKRFPSYFVGILTAAELTGDLDTAFESLAEYVNRDIENQRKVRAALIYPSIVLSLSFVAVLVIILVAVPQFANLFRELGAKLPWPTRVLMNVSNFLETWWWVLLAGAAMSAAMYLLALQTEGGRHLRDRILLKLPAVRYVVQYSTCERFARVLSTMLGAGVSLPESMAVAISGMNNMVYEERLRAALTKISNGSDVATPLRAAKVFPNSVEQMITVGDYTGTLDRQLKNAADYLGKELSYRVDKMTAYFEPAVIVFVAAVVGAVAVSLVSAMYGIYNQVKL
jgi:type IV pilus assembly protein PilC